MPTNTAHRSPPPIEVRLPADTPDEQLPAFLLATIGRIPKGSDDSKWRETVDALLLKISLIKEDLDLRAGIAPVQGLISAGGRDIAWLTRLEEECFGRVRKAMAAAHALMPYIINRQARMRGESLAKAPLEFKRPQEVRSQRYRTLWHETASADHAALKGYSALPKRLPEMTDSEAMEANFTTRVLGQSRPILHLVAALCLRIDQIEKVLQADLNSPDRWQPKGFKTVWIDDGEGKASPRVRVPLGGILLNPELARSAIHLADELLPAVVAMHASGRAKPVTPVRLLLG